MVTQSPAGAPEVSGEPVSPGRRGRARVLAGWALVVLIVVSTAVLAPPSGLPPPEPTGERPPLAFDLPPVEQLRASPRKAFAHYIPSFPVSYDNRPAGVDYYAEGYLDPDGEQGKHTSYGGFVRDRPLPRAPLGGQDWRLTDLRAEVRQAVSVGLDGFALDLLQLGDTGGAWWENSRLLLQAAQEADPGFRVMLMPDMSALRSVDPTTLAIWVSELARSPAAHRLPDGRLVVAPFLAENKSPQWWREFLRLMADRGAPVALLPVFLDERPHREAFSPFSWGLSLWGSRSPAANDPGARGAGSPRGRTAAVHDLGRIWMQPISVQDARPREGIFDEAEATETLRRTWQLAIDGEAQLVQLVTWNDYAEGTSFAPSQRHGWTFLDLSAYYLTWWKLGAPPAIRRDTLLLSHRSQLVAAPTARPPGLPMRLRPGSSPARDVVEVVSLLTGPARVRVRQGERESSCSVPAGVSVCTLALGSGPVSADVVRDGRTVSSATSPYDVLPIPPVQDLQYVAVTSGRPRA